MTITAWVKLTTITPVDAHLRLRWRPTASSTSLPVTAAATHLSLYKGGTTEAIVTITPPVATGTWAHLAIRLDPASSYQLWVNGTMAASLPFAVANPTGFPDSRP